ncbi:MAG: DUF1573 domain-containing protein [Phycisphaerales bacterium]|nr:DUF1573 domain-containing protein [Phycisphaerales bacterium]
MIGTRTCGSCGGVGSWAALFVGIFSGAAVLVGAWTAVGQNTPAQPAQPAPAPAQAQPGQPMLRAPAGQPVQPAIARPAGAIDNLGTPAGPQIVDPGTAPQPPKPAATEPPANLDGPALVFDTNTHDFGKIFEKKPAEHKFRFRNAGKQKLIVTNVASTCGCTVAALTKREFEPGESYEITVTYTPANPGRASKIVTVQSNDPNGQQAQLTIWAEYVPLVRVEPNIVQFGNIKSGETPSQISVIRSLDKNLKITKIEPDDPALTVKQIEKEPTPAEQAIAEQFPGRKVLEFTVAKNAPVGQFNRTVNIHTSVTPVGEKEPREEVEVINVFGFIQGDISPSPNFLRLNDAKAGETVVGEVRITSNSGKKFAVKEVKITEVVGIEGLQAAFEKVGPPESSAYKVTLAGKAPANVGPYRGTVMITTDRDDHGPIPVVFVGIVRPTEEPKPAAPATGPAPAANPAPTPAPAPAAPQANQPQPVSPIPAQPAAARPLPAQPK